MDNRFVLPFNGNLKYIYGPTNIGFHCEYYYDNNGFTPDYQHFHTRYELMLIARGSVRVINDDSELRLHAPCVLLHAPNSYHVVHADDSTPYERFITYFNTSELLRIDSVIASAADYVQKHRFRAYESSENDFSQMLALFTSYRKLTDYGAGLGLAITCALIAELMHCKCSHTADQPAYPKYMSELIEYINLHFTESITAEGLARQFFVGRGNFFASFKKLTSFTPHEYITLLRINLARQLLTEGMSSVDTAKQCGYSTFSTFARTFRIYTKLSPQEYRQKFVKNID